MRSTGNIDEQLKDQLTSDYSKANLSEFEKLMLAYAAKITTEAYTIDKAYIDSLRTHDFTDHILHDIVQVTAYFNYVNRLADGLGVELEQDEGKR